MRVVAVLVATAAAALTASWFHALDAQPPGGSGKAADVAWIGELRKVRRDGDLKGYADLSKWEKEEHFYALGPLEGLRGEVTIIGGKAYLARLNKGQPIVEATFKAKACFLVFARVPKWREVAVPDTLQAEELEDWIKQTARASGVNVERPFPFLLRGVVAKGKVHIVNKTDDKPHTHEDHDKIKAFFDLKHQNVEVLGFFSENHTGVFTCGSNTHMHAVTADKKLSGHVDHLQRVQSVSLHPPDAPVPLVFKEVRGCGLGLTASAMRSRWSLMAWEGETSSSWSLL